MDSHELTKLSVAAVGYLWERFGRQVAADVAREQATRFGAALHSVARLLGVRAATSAWDRLNWQRMAQNYNDRLAKLYGTTTVLGRSQPIPLDDLFTDVYILDKPSALRRFTISELAHDPGLLENVQRTNGLALVTSGGSHRLFVLGKPGAGKTTFLKHLVRAATRGDIARIPIFVSLKEWSDSEHDLMAFIYSQFDICGLPQPGKFVDRLLTSGRALVLFDGLDEVRQDDRQRAKAAAQLRDFSRKHETTQCIITCRIAATDYSFEQYRYVELADFSSDQIRTFVSKWFDAEPKKRDLFFVELDRPHNVNLKELARIPLLLGLLCLTFDAAMTFPARRAELYEEAIDALLKRWDASRAIQRDETYKGLSLGRKRQLLAKIAATTFDANKYFVPEHELGSMIGDYIQRLPLPDFAQDIDGVAVLKAIEAQHGILCERASRIYSFAHLTFQEFFTAKYVVEEASGTAWRRMLDVNRIVDHRWREVILLAASLLEDAEEYFQLFGHALALLASRDRRLTNLFRTLTTIGEAMPGPHSVAVVKVFYLQVFFSAAFLRLPNQDALIDLRLLEARLVTGDRGLEDRLVADEDEARALAWAAALGRDLANEIGAGRVVGSEDGINVWPQGVDNTIARLAGVRLSNALATGALRREFQAAVGARLEVHTRRLAALDVSKLAPQEIQMCIDWYLYELKQFATLCCAWPAPRELANYVQVLTALLTASGRQEASRDLKGLAVPEAHSMRWKQYAQAIAGFVHQSGTNVPPILLARDEVEALLLQLRTSMLFASALNVAAVGRREAILATLLTVAS